MRDLRSFTLHNNPRSVLFLTELILAILIFALSMGICGSIFVKAFEATTTSSDLSNAVFAAENAAEAFQLDDNPNNLAEYLSGAVAVSGEIITYYDRQWQVTGADNALYILNLSILDEGTIKIADITINRGSKEIYNLLSRKNTALK